MTVLAALGMCALLALAILAITATVGAWQRARDRCGPR